MSDPKTTKAAKAATSKVAPVEKPAELSQVTESAAAPVATVDCEQGKEAVTNVQQAQGATEIAAYQSPAQEPLPPGDDGSVKPTAEPLADYIARIERAKLDQDVVAVAITHPEVHADRVHPGTYGGIRLSAGNPAVTYSDGSKA